MITLSYDVNLPDFNKIDYEIQCPNCLLHTWTTVGTIRRNDVVICRGCHSNIVMQDRLGSTDVTIKQITNTIMNWGK